MKKTYKLAHPSVRGGSTVERHKYTGSNIAASVEETFGQGEEQFSKSPMKPGGARFGGLISGGHEGPSHASIDTLPNVAGNRQRQDKKR